MCMYTINLWSYGKHEVIKKEISLLLSSGNVTGQKFFRCTGSTPAIPALGICSSLFSTPPRMLMRARRGGQRG